MTYGERLLQAMDKAGIDRKTLAARLGISKAAVGQVILGSTKMFDAVNHTKACEVLGVSPAWLAIGLESMTSEQSSSGLSLIAHPVTLDKLTVVPTISWEALVSLESLPEVFKLAAPDTSMTPKVLQGTMVELTRNLTPRPGDGVLVRDREGHHYLRVYREKRPGHWEAYALNDAYSPLDSQADGLVVVAVLTAMAGRWA